MFIVKEATEEKTKAMTVKKKKVTNVTNKQ